MQGETRKRPAKKERFQSVKYEEIVQENRKKKKNQRKGMCVCVWEMYVYMRMGDALLFFFFFFDIGFVKMWFVSRKPFERAG